MCGPHRIEGDRISVEVADNGRGIAERDRERVFELFKRSGEQDQPGEGIGLAYVLTVIRNLGGEIRMTSVLDEGTTFRVVLPRELQVFTTRVHIDQSDIDTNVSK